MTITLHVLNMTFTSGGRGVGGGYRREGCQAKTAFLNHWTTPLDIHVETICGTEKMN